MLKAIGADKKALIVTPAVDAKLVKSAANIPGREDRYGRQHQHLRGAERRQVRHQRGRRRKKLEEVFA